MSWGTVTIGGIDFRETWTFTDDGDTVKITGQEEHPPQTKTEVRARHRNVLGLLGATVPAVWTDKSVADGFFVVSDGQSVLTDVQQGAFVTANWSLTLARVGSERDVELESRVPTIGRADELPGAQTPEFWHAPPPATRDYYTGATVPSATVTRTSEEGPVLVYRGIPGNVAPRWTCPAAGYMAGSARVLLDGIRLAGTETPPSSAWELSNGLVRVTGGADATFTVSAYAGAWESAKGFVPTVNGTALTGVPEVTVLRNAPEEVTLRLSYPAQPGRLTVDLGLRRGSRFVTGVSKRHAAAALGISRTAAEAATAQTGGLLATAADADGNRFAMGSSRVLTTLTSTAAISKASVTSFDFFLGHEVGSSPAAGDAFADLFAQFLGTSGDRTRVVHR